VAHEGRACACGLCAPAATVRPSGVFRIPLSVGELDRGDAAPRGALTADTAKAVRRLVGKVVVPIAGGSEGRRGFRGLRATSNHRSQAIFDATVTGHVVITPFVGFQPAIPREFGEQGSPLIAA
jgi:hypothetical protein